MELSELIYRIEGELDVSPEVSHAIVVFVTKEGATFEPIEACPAFDGELLIVNVREVSPKV